MLKGCPNVKRWCRSGRCGPGVFYRQRRVWYIQIPISKNDVVIRPYQYGSCLFAGYLDAFVKAVVMPDMITKGPPYNKISFQFIHGKD